MQLTQTEFIRNTNNVFHYRYVLMGDILQTPQELLGQAEMYLKDYVHVLEEWIGVRGVRGIHTLAFWCRQGLGEQDHTYSLNCEATRYSIYEPVSTFSNLHADRIQYIQVEQETEMEAL